MLKRGRTRARSVLVPAHLIRPVARSVPVVVPVVLLQGRRPVSRTAQPCRISLKFKRITISTRMGLVSRSVRMMVPVVPAQVIRPVSRSARMVILTRPVRVLVPKNIHMMSPEIARIFIRPGNKSVFSTKAYYSRARTRNRWSGVTQWVRTRGCG